MLLVRISLWLFELVLLSIIGGAIYLAMYGPGAAIVDRGLVVQLFASVKVVWTFYLLSGYVFTSALLRVMFWRPKHSMRNIAVMAFLFLAHLILLRYFWIEELRRAIILSVTGMVGVSGCTAIGEYLHNLIGEDRASNQA